MNLQPILAMMESLRVDVTTSHVLQEHPVTKRPVGPLRKDSVLVELTKEEYVAMALLGTFRMLRAESLQVRAKHEAERTVRNDLQGILGEAAVMKALGRNVMDLATIEHDVPLIDKPKGDIGSIEIRATTGLISKTSSMYGPSYASRLIYREGDDPNKVYVLVLGVGIVYEVAGWLRGSEIRRAEWANQGAEWRTKAWMAPVSSLRPIRDLIDVKHCVESHSLLPFIRGEEKKAEIDWALELLRKPADVDELWRQAVMAHGSVK
jgi:hypothetical protein